ncbi:NYN domain-containing protein [Heracleum sosnowskyi]|uniref:NYN domain-containing protein n=1 Tax=Heracleum sosnowskyi TaxID=360622 RepID=A0AAD8JG51_9APIA|nr:NYN domain-containing protein [Heracleum sosnowskyi]KAK1401981.1 NYN domain-containing protein [Heracleum sosnowskyi]
MAAFGNRNLLNSVKLEGNVVKGMWVVCRNVAREVFNPHVGNGLSYDLKRAGFWVKVVSNKRDVAGDELGKCALNVVDMREVGSVVIVSDDSKFMSVLKEAKVKGGGVKTVVVGDRQDGEIKRAFSWQGIILGKAKKEAVSVVGRWNDRDVLKTLEWSYGLETEKTR